LHDSVSQLLYAIQLKIDSLNLPISEYNGTFQNINTLITEAIKETRNISFELAPSILTDFGLAITLEEMTKRLSTETLSIQTKVTGLKRRLRLEMETNIFRIIQELVNNAIKHAQATSITIELINRNKLIEIVVRDNGVGFDTRERRAYHKGSGLSSIKNRVSLFNGKMQVESRPGKGTTTTLLLKDIIY
jgi:signal transduction histidine kinase